VLAEISEVHAKLRNSTSPKLGKELATGDSVVQVDDALKIVPRQGEDQLDHAHQ